MESIRLRWAAIYRVKLNVASICSADNNYSAGESENKKKKEEKRDHIVRNIYTRAEWRVTHITM